MTTLKQNLSDTPADFVNERTIQPATGICCDQLIIAIIVPILCAIIAVIVIIVIIKMRQNRSNGADVLATASRQPDNGSNISVDLSVFQLDPYPNNSQLNEHQRQQEQDELDEPDYTDINEYYTQPNPNSSAFFSAGLPQRDQKPDLEPPYAKVVPVPSHRMTIAELNYFISTEEGINQLERDFKNLPDPKRDNDQMREGVKLENQSKNASSDVLPYDFNRVLLSESANQPGSDYINASKINLTRDYIAAQAPLDGTRRDFWRMLIEKHVKFVVNLTCTEQGEEQLNTCYWPSDNSDDYFDGVSVHKTQQKDNPEFVEYHLSYEDDECITRGELVLLHFSKWPADGVPTSSESVLKLRQRLRGLTQPNDLVLVHCGTGTGVTGTFIALDTLLDEGAKAGSVDVLRSVSRLRMARLQMVQTLEQYLFLHCCIAKGLTTDNDTE